MSAFCGRCAGGAEAADALEDQTAAFLWRWDLREARAVAKKLQPAARDCKKKLQQVLARPSHWLAILHLVWSTHEWDE